MESRDKRRLELLGSNITLYLKPTRFVQLSGLLENVSNFNLCLLPRLQ